MNRKLEKKDKSAYINMSCAFYKTDAVLSKINPENLHKTFQAIIDQNPYVDGFMIEKDGEAAGYALVSFTYSNPMGGVVLLLEELFIKDTYRGKGLGKQSLKELEAYYDDRVVAMRLEVVNDNEPAIRLYSDLGFEDVDYLQMKKTL